MQKAALLEVVNPRIHSVKRRETQKVSVEDQWKSLARDLDSRLSIASYNERRRNGLRDLKSRRLTRRSALVIGSWSQRRNMKLLKREAWYDIAQETPNADARHIRRYPTDAIRGRLFICHAWSLERHLTRCFELYIWWQRWRVAALG